MRHVSLRPLPLGLGQSPHGVKSERQILVPIAALLHSFDVLVEALHLSDEALFRNMLSPQRAVSSASRGILVFALCLSLSAHSAAATIVLKVRTLRHYVLTLQRSA